jgi:hypothetical protein
MYFIVDNDNKVIFGWTPKCGCSHIKRIYKYLKYNVIQATSDKIHVLQKHKLPDDIQNYTTIIICRNPYKRLISGFLDKYKINGEFRHLWKYRFITFSLFINELCKNDWKMVEKHHFAPQTSEEFNKNIIMCSKCVKCYDLDNIDYKFIEELYNKKISSDILNKKEGHERKTYTNNYNDYVYNLYMFKYYCYNVETKYFYNKILQDKVYNFYKEDFIFFNNMGFDYTL